MDNFPIDDFPEEHFPHGAFPTLEELEAKRLADYLRKQELCDYFCALFDENDPRQKLEVVDEAVIIERLEELERQIANPEIITVREYLGNPWVKPLTDIEPVHLEEELDLLMEFMYLYGIAIDFLCEIDDAEAYRFIVEELLDEETDNMAYTGMTAHYIYEEFYPNDEYDVKMWSEDFLLALLRQDEIDDLDYRIGKDELWDSRGNAISHEEFLKQLGRFRKQHRAISNVTITPLTSLITGDEASVVVATTFTSLPAGFNEFIETIGHTKLSLKRSPYYGWDIHQVILPGTHPL